MTLMDLPEAPSTEQLLMKCCCVVFPYMSVRRRRHVASKGVMTAQCKRQINQGGKLKN